MKTHTADEDLPTRVFKVRPDLSSEEALVNACELLISASVMANEQASTASGSQRFQTFGLAHLIESAQLLVNDALEKTSPINP